ncbi:sigma 54-interacting transcriptional regulator [Niallia sp. Krafla_26]|uniref:sigma 54-interacting transcriptional regulator n=1 Tax=Niallia sp. Krafla_26 TaxID=3064703 RepID=UPI003D17BA31
MQAKIVYVGHSHFSKLAKQVLKEIDIPQWVNVEVEEFPYKFIISLESIQSLQTLFEPATIVISGDRSSILLKQSLSNFVIPVKLSGFDIFNQIQKLDSEEVVVVNYRENIQALTRISNLLKTKIRQISFRDRNEAFEIMDQLKEQGVHDVISGSWFYEAASKNGFNAYCYYTYQSMKDASKNALNILKSYRNEMEKSVLFKTIVDMNRSGIISTDTHSKIAVMNHSAERLLGIKRNQTINKDIQTIIPILIEESQVPLSKIDKPTFNIVFEHKDRKFVADIVPVELSGENMGHMVVFDDIATVQQTEQNIRKKMSRKPLKANYTFNDIVGSSEAIKQTISQAKKYSQSDASVLIQGESGTGKELFAQSLHQASSRSLNSFVALNCAAIPENLLDSELFGYEEGSFTGAQKGGKPGKFELAHRGTIFLDEISELPLHLQTRLLRVLQEKEIMRIGGEQMIPVDVRIIAASNKDLLECVKNGTFREDLYYRLNVLQLLIPSLRQRKKDIIELFRYFIRKEEHLNEALSDKDLLILEQNEWKGNIRELENFAERFIVLCQNEILSHDRLTKLLRSSLIPYTFSQNNLVQIQESKKENENQENGLSEITQIKEALQQSNGNKSLAAELLGMSRTTLWRKLKQYHLA